MITHDYRMSAHIQFFLISDHRVSLASPWSWHPACRCIILSLKLEMTPPPTCQSPLKLCLVPVGGHPPMTGCQAGVCLLVPFSKPHTLHLMAPPTGICSWFRLFQGFHSYIIETIPSITHDRVEFPSWVINNPPSGHIRTPSYPHDSL